MFVFIVFVELVFAVAIRQALVCRLASANWISHTFAAAYSYWPSLFPNNGYEPGLLDQLQKLIYYLGCLYRAVELPYRAFCNFSDNEYRFYRYDDDFGYSGRRISRT